jgi:hypothetical protein
MSTTVSFISLAAALVAVGGAVTAIVRERRLAAEFRELRAFRRLEGEAPGIALVEGIRDVRVGQEKGEVLSLLGEPEERIDGDWFYRLDEHSGYVVALDGNDRVRAVSSWKS